MASEAKQKALSYAAAQGDISTLNKLLAEGVDPNFLFNGRTPLHMAVERTRSRYRDDTVTALLGSGADIDAPNHDLYTPLMVACQIGNVCGSRMALKLIELGANVNFTRDSDKACPLTAAVTRAKPEVLEALIDNGAPVDGPRGSLITPLMLAVVQNNQGAVAVLVRRGADLSITCELPWARDKTAEQIAEQEGRIAIFDYLRKAREIKTKTRNLKRHP